MSEFEKVFVSKGYNIIAGIDEAGRGPLAGPVFASVVILPKNHSIEGLADSKKLSEKKRKILFNEIIKQALDYGIASADEKEIDEINILNATFLAMKRAVAKLKIVPDLILVDGNKTPNFGDIATKCIIKGDSLIDSISAASILSKVSRDKFMKELAKKYPQYKFDQHKGYGTKIHYEALRTYGISPVHRKMFLKNFLNQSEKLSI